MITTDREVQWPDGHQCACVLVVNLSVASGPQGIIPSDLSTAAGQFGTQIGIRSIPDVLQRFGMTATFAVPGVMADLYPAMVNAILENGHEVAAHGTPPVQPCTSSPVSGRITPAASVSEKARAKTAVRSRPTLAIAAQSGERKDESSVIRHSRH